MSLKMLTLSKCFIDLKVQLEFASHVLTSKPQLEFVSHVSTSMPQPCNPFCRCVDQYTPALYLFRSMLLTDTYPSLHPSDQRPVFALQISVIECTMLIASLSHLSIRMTLYVYNAIDFNRCYLPVIRLPNRQQTGQVFFSVMERVYVCVCVCVCVCELCM